MNPPSHQTDIPLTRWLPTTLDEVRRRNWQALDVILISGDAYVDHPAFGPAVIGRLIEKAGLRIAMIPQPNWQDDLRDFRKLGAPRLFFGVTSGCMDSMVNHYTAAGRRRSDDAYTPGGAAGFRPDYAVTVYTRILKSLFPDTPVVIGGIEASLRRITHYDFWSNTLKESILTGSGADLLIYGMGERPLTELLRLLEKGVPFSNLSTIPQTAFLADSDAGIPANRRWKDKILASHEECLKSKRDFARNFKIVEQESNRWSASRLIQKNGSKYLVINPPFPPDTGVELDTVFDYEYTRLPHPKYRKRGVIPAYEMIRHSVTSHRGCFGGCSFCTISAHQGKFVVSRSRKSILREIDAVTRMDDFKGHITDIGGPSANMYRMKGRDLEICRKCSSPSCIHPRICANLDISHQHILDLFREAGKHPDVKKITVGSGIRYDLVLPDISDARIKRINEKYGSEMIRRHVSGRLKVAPEHSSEHVLRLMRKPSFDAFRKFHRFFESLNRKYQLNQQLIPYFISSHPGCRDDDMAQLAGDTATM